MHATVEGILLDIEGTTSSISFVHDAMFPFVLKQLDSFLAANFQRNDVRAACEQIARDAGHVSLDAWQSADPDMAAAELVKEAVRQLMANDAKVTGLKALQGLIWEGGFKSGELKAHVYPDVIPAIQRWRENGTDVRIYSSGSVAAQRLFFGHVVDAGNCLNLFSGHYDTNIGSKKERQSYARIADDWGLEPGAILFISDLADELSAAQAAGLQVRASVRPGNASLPETLDVVRITSFDHLESDCSAKPVTKADGLVR